MWLGCGSPTTKKEVVSVLQEEIPEVYVDKDHALVEKKLNGEVYVDGELYSGYLVSAFPNGAMATMYGHLQGKRHGTSSEYYENGNPKSVRTYQKGEKHGIHEGYYLSGQKKFYYIFQDGFSEDNHKQWFENGELYSDMNYLNGKELGKQKVWRPDGKLRANYIVRENGRRYGLQGIKRCTKIDGEEKTIQPYRGKGS